MGGHRHAGGKRPINQKKRNELLVFVLLPQQCPSCTKPVVVAKADVLLESLLPGQRARPGRMAAGEQEEAARSAGAGGLLPPQCSLASLGENGASSPSSSRQEQQWQRVGCDAARHDFPHALQQDVV